MLRRSRNGKKKWQRWSFCILSTHFTVAPATSHATTAADNNESVSSFVRQLTTRHCPHSPAAAVRLLLTTGAPRLCSSRSTYPGRRALTSKPTAAAHSSQTGQTDRQTQGSFIEPARHTMQARPITVTTTTITVSVRLTTGTPTTKLNNSFLARDMIIMRMITTV